MGNTLCSYHGDKIAVDICERCQRPICLEGKRVYRRRHSRGPVSSRRSWSTRHIYCPPCKADVASNASSGLGAIVGSIFFIGIGLIVTAGFASLGGPMAIFPLLIVVFGIYSMIQRSKVADDARKDEQKFLASLKNTPDGIKSTNEYNKFKSYARPDKNWSLSKVNCFVCGESLSIDSNYCSNCGDSTIQEKEYIKNQNR